MDKTLADIIKLRACTRQLLEETLLVRECDDCKKGPCVGRIWSNTVGYAPVHAIYSCDGNFFLSRCSMKLKRRGSDSMIRIEKIKEGYHRVTMTFDQEIREQGVVERGDLPVRELYMKT